jgi:hypothetical protein
MLIIPKIRACNDEKVTREPCSLSGIGVLSEATTKRSYIFPGDPMRGEVE